MGPAEVPRARGGRPPLQLCCVGWGAGLRSEGVTRGGEKKRGEKKKVESLN